MEQSTGEQNAGEQGPGTPMIRNQYRTTSGYQLDTRRLILTGGVLDGRRWTGVVAVGKRVFCGEGEWATDGVYLVTEQTQVDDDGVEANIAIPAFA